MSSTMIAVLLAGIPVMAHALFAATRFMALREEIANAEGQSVRLREPSTDEGGFNDYELDLWDRLTWGPPIDGIDAGLAARATRLGWHLRVQLYLAVSLVGTVVVVGMLDL